MTQEQFDEMLLASLKENLSLKVGYVDTYGWPDGYKILRLSVMFKDEEIIREEGYPS